ncbi:MAG: hypothetical protein AABY22_18330 [Nanoarchaeota archaeon]
MVEQTLDKFTPTKHILFCEIKDDRQLSIGEQKVLFSIIPMDSEKRLSAKWSIKLTAPKEVIRIDENDYAWLSFKTDITTNLEIAIIGILRQLAYLKKTKTYIYNRQQFFDYWDKLSKRIREIGYEGV